MPLVTRDLGEADFRVLPEEMKSRVLQEIESAQRYCPDVPISAGERRKILQDRTLQYYCGGRAVACVRSTTGEGVAILAVGEDEIGALVEAVPAEKWKGVVVEFPEPL